MARTLEYRRAELEDLRASEETLRRMRDQDEAIRRAVAVARHARVVADYELELELAWLRRLVAARLG